MSVAGRSLASETALTLLCPGFAGRRPDWQELLPDDLQLPGLQSLLAGSEYQPYAAIGYERRLAELLGWQAPEDIPLGAYLMAAAEPGVCYACASLVHLRADIGQLRLVDAGRLSVSAAEDAELISDFNRHFFARGVSARAAATGLWQLRLPLIQANTTVLSRVMGASVLERLPVGEGGHELRALMNEIQMLLHEAPVNRARAALDLPVLNGLWIWGVGAAQVSSDRGAVIASIHGGPIAEALARWAGVPWGGAPDSYPSWRCIHAAESGVICVEQLLAPAAYGDVPAWVAAMRKLDEHWFQPLAAALRAGQLGELRIDDGEGLCVRVLPAGA